MSAAAMKARLDAWADGLGKPRLMARWLFADAARAREETTFYARF